uniref:Intracellular protease 1 n=1 Tax=Anthurium amnicola TaxID=1678845 RepID=A0A1D1Z572_9ARAE
MSREKYTIGAIFYKDYDLLDVNGSLRMLLSLRDDIKVITISQTGENVKSYSDDITNVINYSFDNCPDFDILFIPGGLGTFAELENQTFMNFIKKHVPKVKFVLTVCSGSAILAKTGLLDGKRATSNKLFWDNMISQGPNVNWVKKARWVVDGKFYTSSGVSAGMDMALGFISDRYGKEEAERVALFSEYTWHDDPNWDPFSEKTFPEGVTLDSIYKKS